MRIPIIEALRRIYNDLNNKKLDKLTAGTGIDITNNVISSTQPLFSGSYNDLSNKPSVTVALVLEVLNDEEEVLNNEEESE